MLPVFWYRRMGRAEEPFIQEKLLSSHCHCQRPHFQLDGLSRIICLILISFLRSRPVAPVWRISPLSLFPVRGTPGPQPCLPNSRRITLCSSYPIVLESILILFQSPESMYYFLLTKQWNIRHWMSRKSVSHSLPVCLPPSRTKRIDPTTTEHKELSSLSSD